MSAEHLPSASSNLHPLAKSDPLPKSLRRRPRLDSPAARRLPLHVDQAEGLPMLTGIITITRLER